MWKREVVEESTIDWLSKGDAFCLVVLIGCVVWLYCLVVLFDCVVWLCCLIVLFGCVVWLYCLYVLPLSMCCMFMYMRFVVSTFFSCVHYINHHH